MVEIKKYISGHRSSVALFILNIAGATVYVFVSMASWAIPEERAAGIYTVTGEPLIWALRTWPIFMCFGLLNAIWLFRSSIKKWRDGYLLLATAMTWLIAMWIDFAHH